ncbi:SDR family oxidoreductase [Kocuria soli]|uniref:SDR family oxidoreductase n=1 Tax=Kocuria soli TaxID=2485125 RepID=A0A3N4A6N5_9MICC|nr:SDR family oxidoreductase [Kocuria soli]ROZ64599.1 SDR family oxidoreductase [Kocuria soli]
MTENTAAQQKTTESGRQMVAVVTGASTGIGEATAKKLRQDGWTVYAVARRAERLEDLAGETGVIPAATDITDQDQVNALRDRVLDEQGTIDALINISGGARGVDKVGDAKDDDWNFMYDVNVMGTMRLIRAFLPALRENGEGTVLNLTSVAAEFAYEGGSGYNAAKFGQRALTQALRLEEAENNIRVIEVAPGLVHTPEFSLMRLGDQAAADKVYAGVEKPLTSEDVAEVCAFAVNLPHHIDLDTITVKPVAQAAVHKMIRK